MIDLSIIIVSWNVADMLADCLDSIRANTDWLSVEVIVVDSASSDHTVDMLQSRYDWVISLPQTENVGFSRGNNIGLAAAKGRHLLLLNPDTEVIDDMLPRMVLYLDGNPDVGIIGPHTYNTDGTTQSSRRRFPTLQTLFFESTWLQPFAPAYIIPHFTMQDTHDDETIEVDWVQGHALMARREVYLHIGGLDEGFVMYSEEMDWCKRAKDNGWEVVYVADAHVTHHGGQSSAQAGAYKYIQFNRSKIRYAKKHHGTFSAWLLRLVLLKLFAFQLLLEGAKWLVRHKPAMRRERVNIYWQVLRSGL